MRRLVIAFVALGCPASLALAQATFRRLGDLPGAWEFSEALVVSADGKVVAGDSVTGGSGFFGIMEAFRVTAESAPTVLDGSYAPYTSQPYAISADGGVIAGHVVITPIDVQIDAMRWTDETGMELLGDLPGGLHQGYIRGMSADGSIMVGHGSSTLSYGSCLNCTEAFIWTREGGMEALGDVEGGRFSSRAASVSADGSVIAGDVAPAGVLPEAARWTRATGWQPLGYLPDSRRDKASEAYAISADGKVIVGRATNAVNYEAYRWTEDEGMVGLGDLPGDPVFSTAYAASADGSVVVGVGVIPGGLFGSGEGRAFIWTKERGMREVYDVLTQDYGLDLRGWILLGAWGVSGDGRTIVGEGTNPEGWVEGWIATLPGTGCRPDCNGDGTLSINDFICFQAKWRSRDVYGDFDGSGTFTVNDFIRFQAAWAKGCE